jgi:hypothetical protein
MYVAVTIAKNYHYLLNYDLIVFNLIQHFLSFIGN